MKENSLAILYIALGNYSIFWNKFFKSCEENFCIDLQKHYFVFSDNPNGLYNLEKKISVYHQDNLGWPCSTLLRYHMFSRAKELLKDYQYICYFNANTLFVESISTEEFFGQTKGKLIGGLHPGYINKTKKILPFEKRESSKAFTRNNDFYFQGCINGGYSRDFLSAIEVIKNNITEDLNNGIVSIWHDESHWNSYLNEKIKENSNKVKILNCNYLWPEGLGKNNDLKILMRDKNLFGGHELLRGVEKSQYKLYLQLLKKIKLKIKNLLKIFKV
tara:strand:+ start:243 stop:1064 length:822 start_codon:yes stop_codon:yes gene_type:complete